MLLSILICAGRPTMMVRAGLNLKLKKVDSVSG